VTNYTDKVELLKKLWKKSFTLENMSLALCQNTDDNNNNNNSNQIQMNDATDVGDVTIYR
jgi:hypothetical protein